ncbi:50S ribosomal protein L21 [Paracoccus sp. S-4012]|nr:50S ribosomal protein L21 [Paracoccus sp. S-4012]
MFAILKTGGKQYRVQPGDVLRVEKLNAAAGDTVQFNDILMVGSTIGSPLVSGACVQAEVLDQIKADKVITFHKRRRKHSSQRTRGHRQQLTLLRVTDVLESGAERTDVAVATGTRAARRAGEADVTRTAPGTDRFALNRTEQPEMSRRVASGAAGEKPAETETTAATAAPQNTASEV